MDSSRSVWCVLCACMVLPPCLAAAPAPLLAVGQPAGGTLLHGMQARAAQERDALAAGDTATASAGGSMGLRLGHYGEIELGPASTLSVTRLPFSSFASDLSTELKLDAGTMRLVWKYPALSAPWPLVVSLGGFRATLTSGEYYFSADAVPTICVRGGQAALESGGQLLPSTLKPAACYQLAGNDLPAAQPRNDRDFMAMRASHVIGARTEPPPPMVAADTGIPYTVPRHRRPAAAPAVVAQPAAPAPAQTVAAAVPPAPAVAGGWIVVASSLEDEAAAQREVAKLQAAGYAPDVESAEVKGRTWYRVQLHGPASLGAARMLAAEIRKKLAYPDPWVRKQN